MAAGAMCNHGRQPTVAVYRILEKDGYWPFSGCSHGRPTAARMRV